jgi:predicted nucleic acid-binding protein
MSRVFVDTSVLVKRYLFSPQSDAVEAMLERPSDRFIVSELCAVELESVVARRARESSGKRIDRNRTRLSIDEDLRSGFFDVVPLNTSIMIAARRWIAEGEPLATLDALHLASALAAGAEVLATDDKQFARAARAAGLRVTTFL